MRITKKEISDDNTVKYFFEDRKTNNHIESCLLNLKKYGYIICVSSQIGCSQRCKFCAAGNGKFIRNLTALEIFKQVELIVLDNKQLETNPFQVTYMGSGEPFNNYTNIFKSIELLRNKFSNLTKINISSTFPKSSLKFINETPWSNYRDFLHLQYSLHFSNDYCRKKYLCNNLLEIIDVVNCLNKISKLTNDVYKINYIPFDNLNDQDNNIDELVTIMNQTDQAILKISRMCKINNSDLLPSSSFEIFSKKLKQLLPATEVFSSDGTDINAGCGQFYNDSIL